MPFDGDRHAGPDQRCRHRVAGRAEANRGRLSALRVIDAASMLGGAIGSPSAAHPGSRAGSKGIAQACLWSAAFTSSGSCSFASARSAGTLAGARDSAPPAASVRRWSGNKNPCARRSDRDRPGLAKKDIP